MNADAARADLPPPLPARAALFLDFDGTLVELAPTPAEVRVPAATIALLAALQARLQGAVAVVSGRRLGDLDRLLAPLRLPGAGLHGAELRLAGGHAVSQAAGALAARLLPQLRERFGDDPRLLLEDKGASLALHYRAAPERGAECLAAMRELAGACGLAVLAGKQVVEALPAGIDKGQALRALCARAPFRGRRPVFLGDDRTDEDGFRAARELGGFGVKVGAGETDADFRCPTPGEVRAWLADGTRD